MLRAISRKTSQNSLQDVAQLVLYLFEIRYNTGDSIELEKRDYRTVEIFDGTCMKRKRNVVVDILKDVLHAIQDKLCKTSIYKIKGKYYVSMDWRNVLFFGDQAVLEDFHKLFNNFRWSYIKSLLDTVTRNIHYEKVGSNSYVSDIDISISPRITFSAMRPLSAYAQYVKDAFTYIMLEHAKYFQKSFEDIFDTNIYATNFTFQASNIDIEFAKNVFPVSLFQHYTKEIHPGIVHHYFIPRIDKSTYHVNDIRIFHISQTIFAFRRLFNFFIHHAPKKNLYPNLTKMYRQLNYNSKSLIKSILPSPYLIKYYMYTNIHDVELMNEYTTQVYDYYKTMEIMLASPDRVASHMTIAINALSTATLMEMDSYHSYGAFIDIVTLSGESYESKSKYMHGYMKMHSMLDNLGFVVDVLHRHDDDTCYDVMTRILKVSKYIERICRTLSNISDDIQAILDNSIRANASRKAGTLQEKIENCIGLYRVITKQTSSMLSDIQISYFTDSVLTWFDPYVSCQELFTRNTITM